jgi:glucose-6-phosphate isomerase
MSEFRINHTETSGVSNTDLLTHTKSLSAYRDHLKAVADTDNFNEPESALRLPDLGAYQNRVRKHVSRLQSELDPSVTIVVGMGGSIRGTKAVYDLSQDSTKKSLLFVDTIAGNTLTKVAEKTAKLADSLDSVAVCVVSKSGTTAETVANAELLEKKLADTFSGDLDLKQVVYITEAGSPLVEDAPEASSVFTIPDQISGRFSVFSAAGVVPLSLVGINIKQFLSGGAEMRSASLSGRPTSDPAAALAGILYEQITGNRKILNQYFFTPQARSLADWSTQAFAESLGKKTDNQGKQVFTGLYPTTSFAPEDLHALFQLQLGGPKNFFSLVIRETDNQRGDLSEEITAGKYQGHTLGDLKSGLAEAMMESFKEAGRPFAEIAFPQFSPVRIGQLMMLEQIIICYLADLLEINAFDQPEVENYKRKLRDKLL